MGAILVAMPKHDDSGRIADIIKESDIWEDIFICDTGSDVLRKVEDMDISLVVCTRKMQDMGYEEMYNYLPSNVSMLLLISSIRMLLPAGYRRTSKRPVTRSMGDKLTIDKAKMLLMERNNMTEPEAYRYMQKNSMDMGRTLSETAQMILSLNKE